MFEELLKRTDSEWEDAKEPIYQKQKTFVGRVENKTTRLPRTLRQFPITLAHNCDYIQGRNIPEDSRLKFNHFEIEK